MSEQAVSNRAECDVDQVVHAAFFRGRPAGRVCVEVGAARPDFLSVGAFFRQQGWRVLSVEPNPAYCEMHRARGHEVYQFACGDRDADGVEFYIVDSHGVEYQGGQVSFESFSSLGIRGGYADMAEGRELGFAKVHVQLRKLDTLLAQHAPEVRRLDLLVVDVEGWELEVLRGLDFRRHRPRVLVIENLFRDQAYHEFMRARGYELWRELPPNDVYVPRRGLAGRALRWLRRMAGGR